MNVPGSITLLVTDTHPIGSLPIWYSVPISAGSPPAIPNSGRQALNKIYQWDAAWSMADTLPKCWLMRGPTAQHTNSKPRFILEPPVAFEFQIRMVAR